MLFPTYKGETGAGGGPAGRGGGDAIMGEDAVKEDAGEAENVDEE